MSPSKYPDKQRATNGAGFPFERRQTRQFAKANHIDVPKLSLEELVTITRKGHAPRSRRRSFPARSKSQTLKSTEVKAKPRKSRSKKPKSATQRHSGITTTPSRLAGETRIGSPKRGRQCPLKPGQKVSFQPQPQSCHDDTEPRPISRMASRESQGRDLVTSWLQLTSQNNPADLEEPSIPSSQPASVDIGGMSTSRAHNASSTNENGSALSIKASTVRKATSNTFMEHLEFRGITDEPSEDDSLLVHDIVDKLGQEKGIIKCRQLDSLVKILNEVVQIIEESIDERASEDGFSIYDSLRERILDWIPDSTEYRRFPPVCSRHFEWDRIQCDNSNEADFQRTIMMDIIDRYDFRDKFAFSCEETWSVEPQYLIKPSRKTSVIKQPKPDLAISFQRNIIKKSGRLDYPIELGSCLHPGNKGRQRWFPFLFLEAERADASLRDAFETNLLNASQALSNIYQWMRQVSELEQKFFDEVRVMTITLNNQFLTLRMHRAERSNGDYLQYEFTTVRKILSYSRSEACNLIKSILIDFAIPYLLPILAETYDKVAKLNFKSNGRSKRKQSNLNDRGSELGGGSMATESIASIEDRGAQEQPVQSTGNSIAMEKTRLSVLPFDPIPDSTGGNPPKRSRRVKKATMKSVAQK